MIMGRMETEILLSIAQMVPGLWPCQGRQNQGFNKLSLIPGENSILARRCWRRKLGSRVLWLVQTIQAGLKRHAWARQFM